MQFGLFAGINNSDATARCESECCAVQAMLAYLEVRLGPPASPLFLLYSGQYLTGHTLSSVITRFTAIKILQQQLWDWHHYLTGHSRPSSMAHSTAGSVVKSLFFTVCPESSSSVLASVQGHHYVVSHLGSGLGGTWQDGRNCWQWHCTKWPVAALGRAYLADRSCTSLPK